jgi:two-component system KDP operon response regulator KdpE
MSDTAVHVLIVDDELHIRRLLAAAVRRGGYEPLEAANAREAESLADIVRPGAALVDLGLPDRDGLELVGRLSAKGLDAIIVVSAREAIEDKVAALDLGASDYVTKPFDTDELLARLRASLRRRGGGGIAHPIVRADGVEIDLDRRIVRKGGEEVRLTPKEWGFLAELAKAPGRVITHGQLLRAVWGPAHEGDVEYLRVTARGLRVKLEEEPARPVLIRNEPGIGYRLRAEGLR